MKAITSSPPEPVSLATEPMRFDIESRIHTVRNIRVILAHDLAILCNVSTRTILQKVNRNPTRFPEEFAFRITEEEVTNLKSSDNETKVAPYAFTEQGVAILSSMFAGEHAIRASIAVLRTLVRLRELVRTQHTLEGKLEQLEEKYDTHLHVVFEVLNALVHTIAPEEKPRFGFLGDR